MSPRRRARQRDGTAQADRYPNALAAGYFDVDERRLHDLIVLGERLATNVRFFDTGNRSAGTWEDLFRNDEVFALADIASVRCETLAVGFRRLAARDDLAGQVRSVVDLAARIDFWLSRLDTGEPDAPALGATIAQLVEDRLAESLHVVLEFAHELELDEASLGIARLARDWRLSERVTGDMLEFRAAQSAATPGHRARRTSELASRFAIFLNAVRYVQSSAVDALEQRLRTQRHDPALGLYIVFLQLFAQAQASLNAFGRRRLDFYYRRLLGATLAPAEPDHVHLAFTLAPGTREVRVPAGTRFVAGKDLVGDDVTFIADRALHVRDTCVTALHTVALRRDPLISPETEFGFATGSATATLYERPIKAASGGMAEAGGGDASRSLFGVDPSDAAPGTAATRLGFYIASAALDLAEGRRSIVADIIMEPLPIASGSVPDSVDDALATLVRHVSDETAFQRCIGRIVSRDLLTTGGWLTADERTRLLASLERWLSEQTPERSAANAIDVVREHLELDRAVLFHRLLRDAFVLRFSTPTGWQETQDFHLAPLEPEADVSRLGLRLVFEPGPEVEPIVPVSSEVHGDAFDTVLPVLGLRLNPGSVIHARSLFDDVAVRRVELHVGACGVTDIRLWNSLGRLDPAQPFQPFGPLPGADSYLVLGCPELAHKRPTTLDVALSWSELPRGGGGFEQRYAGYSRRYDVDTLRARSALLQHGEWREDSERTHPLFERREQDGWLERRRRLRIDTARFGPVGSIDDARQLAYSTRARNGFVRLSLAPTPHGFGHAEYPRRLTETLTANARRRKAEPLPEAPYTPLIGRLSIDYTASATLHVGSGEGDGAAIDKLLHEHPFGWRALTTREGRDDVSLLPRPVMDGLLMIGLSGSHPAGVLTLLFHLQEEASEASDIDASVIRWFYLADDRWQALEPARILSDSTNGFLRSGIVTLDVPQQIRLGNTVLAGDRYWLAVGADRELGQFPRLYSVTASALSATRVDADGAKSDALPGYPGGVGATWQCSVPGLGAVRQTGASVGARPAETEYALERRIAERLRHKQRALTPWDHEHLVLQRFPAVAKVKCFANTEIGVSGPSPGQVLVVVVADAARHATNGTPRLSAAELHEIRTYLQGLSSPCATVTVRNPAFEQVQIRCTVRLSDEATGGDQLHRLDASLSAFISPWATGGYGATFDWTIQRKDIEAHLLSLPEVEFVTDFSMLRISRDLDGLLRLDDTAGSRSGSGELTVAQIDEKWRREELRPRFPWSLAVPTRRHYIELASSSREIEAEPTGVGELEVGNTLILGSKNRHG